MTKPPSQAEQAGPYPSPLSGNTRIEQRERTRTAIIESAVKLFAEVGFDAAKTRTVAARAHVNHGLVHYYFSNKLELWKAAIDYLFEQAHLEMETSHDGDDLGNDVERLRAMIHRYVQFSARFPEYARILFDEGRKRSPRLDWIVERYLRRNFETFDDLIRRLQLRNRLPNLSPLVLQYMIFGMGHTLFTLAPEVSRKSGVDPTKDKDLIADQAKAIELMLIGTVDHPIDWPRG